MPSSKKRVFDAVRLLDSQDAAAAPRQTHKDVQRSQAAQSQTAIYSSLVECRILLQRSMTAVSSSSSKKQKTVDSCNQLLQDLLLARHKLTAARNDNSEEDPAYDKLLASDDDEADTLLCQQLQQEYQSCRDEWKITLNRRHQDARLHAGQTQKFLKVLDASFWDQVESTVQHEQLRQRMMSPSSDDDHRQLFDDSKVYQHLLKDFCATASANSKQPAGRLRTASKKKKDVDRRASKGRKIRYTEIAKLANFTFPKSRTATTSTLQEDEWFRSLFGGVGAI